MTQVKSLLAKQGHQSALCVKAVCACAVMVDCVQELDLRIFQAVDTMANQDSMNPLVAVCFDQALALGKNLQAGLLVYRAWTYQAET